MVLRFHAPFSFERTGTGPALVLVHGLGTDRTAWADEIARLEKRHTVLTLDLPGHGASPPTTRIDLPWLGEQIARLLRAEGLAPAVVIGHSLGGAIAPWVAIADPSAVKGLVIVDSSLAAFPLSRAERARLRESMQRDHEGQLRRFFGRLTKGDRQTETVVAMARRVPLATFFALLEAAADQPAGQRGREITAPMLVLASPLLISQPWRAREQLAKAGYRDIRHLSYEVFAEARHWIFWDEPALYAAAVDRFLGDPSQAAAGGLQTVSSGPSMHRGISR